MGFLDHQGESEFPFVKETVFNAMVKAIPTVKGMKVDNADKLQGRIVVKAGVSLMSWGENIPILLTEISENRTKVSITSTPKTGVMFGGAFDLGKNRKNIEQILSVTSRILSTENKSNPETLLTSENRTSNNLKTEEIMEQNQTKKWYDNKFVVHLLLVIFFPVGLYALWKTDTIAKWWKITATVLIGFIVIANIGNTDKGTTTEVVTDSKETVKELTQAQKDSIASVERANLLEERKDGTISASNLVASYVENEVAADNNFKGKKFYVEGYIDNIGKDILDKIYVTLKSGDIIRSVQCYIDDQDKVANLKKGQKITIIGKCDGLMMNVLMKNCKLVENMDEL